MCQFFRMICSLNDTFWVTATKTLTWNTVQALTRLPQWVNPTWHFYLPHLIVTYLCTMRFEEMHWTALLVKYWLVHVYVWIFFSMFSGLFKAGSSQKRIRHTAHCGCALCSVSNFLESHTVCYILMTAVYKRCFHISLSEALSTNFFRSSTFLWCWINVVQSDFSMPICTILSHYSMCGIIVTMLLYVLQTKKKTTLFSAVHMDGMHISVF